ncbi:MAG: hypothetical protein HY056_11545 [Proteobacteria bacterium]|nr:hypothetical protein [Pseudomonadota bacterium]
MVAMPISAALVEPLGNAIGDRFGFRELDIILYKCFSDRKINEIASETQPPRIIARECLVAVEREGYEKIFLAHVIFSRPGDDDLRALVAQALPAALEVLPEIKAQVEGVLAALERTRQSIADPRTKSAIGESRDRLEFVIKGISLLDIYKNLHDSLHRIQMRPFPALLAAARNMRRIPILVDNLREYQDQVRISVETAKSMLDRLADEPALRSVEERWISKLEDVSNKYQQSLDARDTSAASVAIYRFWRLLEYDPKRLNERIFETAKALPLAELSAALRKVSEALGNDAGEIANADASLASLRANLRSRVAEHDMWQKVDDDYLWPLDKAFVESITLVEDFNAVWPETKLTVGALASLNPDAAWSRNVRKYSDNIDDELARAATAPGADDAAGEEPMKNLGRRFNEYRSEVRFRFFAVDNALKRECGMLIRLGDPLRSLLRELGDDE